jgi:hypothetical protein
MAVGPYAALVFLRPLLNALRGPERRALSFLPAALIAIVVNFL